MLDFQKEHKCYRIVLNFTHLFLRVWEILINNFHQKPTFHTLHVENETFYDAYLYKLRLILGLENAVKFIVLFLESPCIKY